MFPKIMKGITGLQMKWVQMRTTQIRIKMSLVLIIIKMRIALTIIKIFNKTLRTKLDGTSTQGVKIHAIIVMIEAKIIMITIVAVITTETILTMAELEIIIIMGCEIVAGCYLNGSREASHFGMPFGMSYYPWMDSNYQIGHLLFGITLKGLFVI